MKNPKTTPTKVVTISLMVSFGFLLTALQPRRLKCYIKKVVIIYNNTIKFIKISF
jgi:hypothetical protein